MDADDSINPDKLQAWIARGPANYFLAWRVYRQEVADLRPSKVAPGWCLQPMSAAARAAYDAPFPDPRYTAAARRFPMLVPITADDPERELNEAAWAVLRKWQKPFLTLWGDRCPFTYTQLGRQFQTQIPGAQLPGIEHKVYAASHFIQEDMGEALAQEIVRFIRSFP